MLTDCYAQAAQFRKIRKKILKGMTKEAGTVQLREPVNRLLHSCTTGKAIAIIVVVDADIAAWTEHKAGDAVEACPRWHRSPSSGSGAGGKSMLTCPVSAAAASCPWEPGTWSPRTCGSSRLAASR